MKAMNPVRVGVLGLLALIALAATPARAAVIYSNDFETDAAGFDVANRAARPSDAVGGTSTYLVAAANSSATLTLAGLTPGVEYHLAFDLFIGGTWDGSLSFGPDFFSLSSSSAGTLVNATFRNGFPIGSATPGQTYSDATPLGDGGLFRTREGADVEIGEPIYYFGHGAGNPLFSFTAAAASETLVFGSQDAQGITDEYFALDNVLVTTVPEPASMTVLLAPLLALAIRTRRRA